jgi:hypothetical protein
MPFSDNTIGLLERMSENVSLALDGFEQERARERIARMFAALGAANEATIRARTRQELCDLVCEAAVFGDTSMGNYIWLVEPGDAFLRIVAAGIHVAQFPSGAGSHLVAGPGRQTSSPVAAAGATPRVREFHLIYAREFDQMSPNGKLSMLLLNRRR